MDKQVKAMLTGNWDAEEWRSGVPAVVRNSNWDGTVAAALESDREHVFTVGRGYFYRHGCDAEKFAASAVKKLEALDLAVELVACGDRWAAFDGGSKMFTAKESFFWAVVKLTVKGN